jgi:glycosyltransferase involved in cell wall biosynthesis
MRLFVDGRAWAMTGIGRYIQGMAAGMMELEGFCPSLTMGVQPKDLASVEEEVRPYTERGAGLRIVPLDVKPLSFREMAAGSKLAAAAEGATHILFPHWNVPLDFTPPVGTATVLVIHDLLPWRFPAYSRSLKSAVGRCILRHAISVSGTVVANSHKTALEIQGTFRKRAEVVYPPMDSDFLNPGSMDRESVPIHRPYVLCVAGNKPHKNVSFLLEAWARSSCRHRMTLLLVGYRMDPAEKWSRGQTVVALERVPDQMLRQLYAHACFCCFPSLDEGFGYPPLEALAMGTPALASPVPSVRELFGAEACVPLSQEAWIEALDRAGQGEFPLVPDDRARQNLALLSPKASAEKLLKILKEAR